MASLCVFRFLAGTFAPPDKKILRRLVALNAERAEEEKRGLVRWLRPDFQNPAGTAAGGQETLGLKAAEKAGVGKRVGGRKSIGPD